MAIQDDIISNDYKNGHYKPLYIHTHISMYIYVFIHIFIHVYISTHIYKYIHTVCLKYALIHFVCMQAKGTSVIVGAIFH